MWTATGSLGLGGGPRAAADESQAASALAATGGTDSQPVSKFRLGAITAVAASAAQVGSTTTNAASRTAGQALIGTGNAVGSVATSAVPVLTAVGSAVAAVTGSPFAAHRDSKLGKFRGVFHSDTANLERAFEVGAGGRGDAAAAAHAVDFRQRLDLILVTEDNTRNVANKLYEKLEGGDMARLPIIFKLLEEKWGFPNQVFANLFTHLRRATNQADDPAQVTSDEWADAFVRWLHTLKALSERAKVSRQCLIHARHGNYMQETYLQGAKLGEGAFGEVFVVLHKALSIARVVKIVSKLQLGMASETIESEVNLLKSLDHPHIVRIFETFETADDLNIIMDYAEGGDLSGVIRHVQGKGLPETWARSAAEQITSALEYMHSRAVIHCDLKPANVMLLHAFDPEVQDLPHCLLVDFGLAEIFEERNIGERVKVKGTPLYLAPEGFEGHLTQKSDMWAVGIMVFEMILGRRPYKESKSIFLLWSQIAKSTLNLDDLPINAAELTRALLQKDPKDRPTASDCRKMDWFTQAESEAVDDSGEPPKPMELGHLNYFHRSVMFCIAAGLSLKDMPALYEVFQKLDKEKTGYLSLSELTEGMMMLGIDRDPKALMSVMDMDQSGCISYTEFLAGALRADEHLNDRLVQYAFDMFDLDGDGYITMHELRLMLSGGAAPVDVLPDGLTIAQLMDEMGQGEGRITFAQFRTYLGNVQSEQKVALPRFSASSEKGVAMLIRDLEEESQKDVEEDAGDDTQQDKLPCFHAWLAELQSETHHGASFGFFLTFDNKEIEASYVAQEMPGSSRQMSVLALILCVYSLWALTTSRFKIQPSFAKWDNEVLITHNLGWIALMLGAGVVFVRCFRRARSQGWSRDGASDDAYDLQAIRFEIFLCIWACLVPWVSCFFANRFRVAAMFGKKALDVFPSMNSDYDLIMAILGTLTFFSTRTHARFVCVFAIAISCCMAYASSTTMFGIAQPGCGEKDGNWVWPGLLLVSLTGLALSGHRAVEYHRRMTFLTHWYSYEALKEFEKDDPDVLKLVGPKMDTTNAQEQNKLKRFKTAMDMLAKFIATKEMGSRPLRSALHQLSLVCQEVRDDIVEAEMWVATDVRGALQTHGVSGTTRDALLALFGEVQLEDVLAVKRSTTSMDVFGSDAPPVQVKPPVAVWGWNALSGSAHPLLEAGELLLIPTLSVDFGPDAEMRGRSFLELLLRSYGRRSQTAEARAALSMRVAHWLAQELQLWDALQPHERVAMLAAAAGLHCEGGAHTFTTENLLCRVQSANATVDALDKSNMVISEHSASLRHTACRAMIRARPRTMLQDAQALRVQINKYGQLQAAGADRPTIISLVVATASYSWLALPHDLHEKWALHCQDEAALEPSALLRDRKDELDVACWLRALIEVLMLPMYDTLSVYSGVGDRLHAPQTCLHENSKFWKTTKLAATRSSSLQMQPSLTLRKIEEDAVDAPGPGIPPIELQTDQLLSQRPPSKPVTPVSSPPAITVTPPDATLPGQVDIERGK